MEALFMSVTSNAVKQLHEQTGAGYMDAKRALEIANGDVEKAIIVLREKGISIAKKKTVRIAKEGILGVYLHSNERIGVMLELNCETDFAAATKIFKNLAHNLAMHIAAMNPTCISRADISPEMIAEEKKVYEIQARNENKPETAIDAIVEGKLKKYYQINCLLDQPYFKDSSKSVNDIIVEGVAVLKENITVKRFVRYEIGE
jgi:elongation factor Ts